MPAHLIIPPSSHFAPLYPIIHRPSLGYRRLPPDLLLTMLCIGTAFSEDKEGFRISMRIHKRLRNRIFEVSLDTCLLHDTADVGSKSKTSPAHRSILSKPSFLSTTSAGATAA